MLTPVVHPQHEPKGRRLGLVLVLIVVAVAVVAVAVVWFVARSGRPS